MPKPDGTIRLVTRLRETYPKWRSPRMAYTLLSAHGDIVMNRKQLLGIKARAERLAAMRRIQAPTASATNSDDTLA